MTSISVVALDHITIIVDDVQASREFYVNLLGMKEARRPEFDFPGAWFQAGSTMVHATLSDEKSGRAGWGDHGNAAIASRGHHFAFIVDDVDKSVPILEDARVKFLSELKIRPDGAKQIFVADPDGHVVELTST